MQTIRSAARRSVPRNRRGPVFGPWGDDNKHGAEAETTQVSVSGHRSNASWILQRHRHQRAETTGPMDVLPSRVIVIAARARKARLLVETTQTALLSPPTTKRFFCYSRANNRTRGKDSRGGLDDDPKAGGAERILLLLKDEDACPVGSMNRAQTKEAEDALEYWVSAASPPRQRRRQRRNGNNNGNNKHQNRHCESYRRSFENARSILSRLALEQKFHDNNEDNPGTSRDSTKTERTGLVNHNHYNGIDDDNACYNEQQQRLLRNGSNEYDDFYFVRPFLLNRVVDCWRRGWRDGQLEFTPNEMIAWVEEVDNSNTDVLVSDSRTLTMIVDGICLRGDLYEAPLLAQWLLDRRLGQAYADEDDTTLRPDTVFFTNVIRSWAKSGRVEAPEMADGLLQMMHELYANSGWTESAPNAFSYSATMEAWAKSQRHLESIRRIEALLEEMKNSNLVQVVPDRVSYQYVLNAWANYKSPIGAEKAHKTLQEMIALYEAGNVLVAPNASNFSRVIMALAQNGDDERSESVLEQLQDLYSKTGDPSFQPTDECWKACIIAKAKTGGVAEAQVMLDELVERAVSNNNTNKHLMPRRGYFVDTLVGWTKLKDKTRGAEMSQRVLERMSELARRDESFRNLQPDAKTFQRVILAWSRSRHHSAPERIDRLLREMDRRFDGGSEKKHKTKAELAGYTNLMLAWHRSGRKESVDAIQKIFDELRLRSVGGEEHLRPDRYVFGILIDSWARRNDLARVESVFEEMMTEWKSGNGDACPDAQVFHKILKAYSKGSRKGASNAVEKCEYYFSLMKDSGLPTTLQAHCYLVDAFSSKTGPEKTSAIHRASEVLDELLESVREGTTPSPPSHRDYRQFLQTIANSGIPRRNQQAKNALASFSRGAVPIPKGLLPLNTKAK